MVGDGVLLWLIISPDVDLVVAVSRKQLVVRHAKVDVVIEQDIFHLQNIGALEGFDACLFCLVVPLGRRRLMGHAPAVAQRWQESGRRSGAAEGRVRLARRVDPAGWAPRREKVNAGDRTEKGSAGSTRRQSLYAGRSFASCFRFRLRLLLRPHGGKFRHHCFLDSLYSPDNAWRHP